MLDYLPHVHQLAQHGGRARRFNPDDHVARFGRGQVVTYRADTADTWSNSWHLEEHPSFAELLETTELVYM